MSPRTRILLAALLFSTGGAGIKAAALTPWQVASFRSGIAALTLLVAVPAARRGFGWRPALVGLAYAATLITFVLANRLTTSANSIFLQSTAPLYLLLLGPWLLHEPVRWRDLPVLGSVLSGLILVFLGADRASGTAPHPVAGDVLAAVSGICFALLLCGLRWLGRDTRTEHGGLTAVVLGNITAFVVVFPLTLPVGHPPLLAWGIISYLGAFQIAGAYLLLAHGMRHIGALDSALLLLVETALNPFWAWLVLGEVPTGLAIAGGALIAAATVVQTTRGGQPTRTLEPV